MSRLFILTNENKRLTDENNRLKKGLDLLQEDSLEYKKIKKGKNTYIH